MTYTHTFRVERSVGLHQACESCTRNETVLNVTLLNHCVDFHIGDLKREKYTKAKVVKYQSLCLSDNSCFLEGCDDDRINTARFPSSKHYFSTDCERQWSDSGSVGTFFRVENLRKYHTGRDNFLFAVTVQLGRYRMLPFFRLRRHHVVTIWTCGLANPSFRNAAASNIQRTIGHLKNKKVRR